MEKLRVDIELPKEVVRWAAIEAAKVGLSRRQFLSKCIIDKSCEVNNSKSNIKTV